MVEIRVTPTVRHEFSVEVADGDGTTSHRVIVPDSLLADLGATPSEEEDIVRESFAFLLEREPAQAILPEFSLAIISRYFPEYTEQLPMRLEGMAP